MTETPDIKASLTEQKDGSGLLTIDVDDETHNILQQMAEESGITIDQVVRNAIDVQIDEAIGMQIVNSISDLEDLYEGLDQ